MFNTIKIITIGLIGVTMLLSVFLALPVSADDVVDDITINVPVSCTLSGTNLTHNASMTGGQYKTDIGSANIKAVCNDTNGLAVYAIGYSDDTFGNNKMISSTVDHTYDIPTGKYSSGDTDSSWSMKLTPVSGTYAPTIRNDANYDFTDSEIIPSTYTKVAYRTSATDSGSGAIGANFTTTYGIYVSTTQPADTYTGKVKFTLVHPYDAPTPEPTYDMQNLSIDKCPTTSPINVVDVRDGEVYKAQRLADDKCWLLDNLRLDSTTVDIDTLKGNTNASDTTLDYFKNGGGTASDQYATAGVSSSWNTYSYSAPLINAASKDTISANSDYGAGNHKVGIYYNYCAASAGSYCYGNGTSAGTFSGDATEDICPALWRMPTSSEYQALYTAYSSDATIFRNALSTPLSGGFDSGSTYGQGDYGYFWSSTRSSNYSMRGLSVYDSSVSPAEIGGRGGGFSVRCVLK
ncbi:hypothetical protein IKF92_03065 [Candidatus Saccharibacteria bacterium]|nr:hypothetical protein [Candidatus Saccharibacteria bacterium]